MKKILFILCIIAISLVSCDETHDPEEISPVDNGEVYYEGKVGTIVYINPDTHKKTKHQVLRQYGGMGNTSYVTMCHLPECKYCKQQSTNE